MAFCPVMTAFFDNCLTSWYNCSMATKHIGKGKGGKKMQLLRQMWREAAITAIVVMWLVAVVVNLAVLAW